MGLVGGKGALLLLWNTLLLISAALLLLFSTGAPSVQPYTTLALLLSTQQTPDVLQDPNPDSLEGLQGKTPAVEVRGCCCWWWLGRGLGSGAVRQDGGSGHGDR